MQQLTMYLFCKAMIAEQGQTKFHVKFTYVNNVFTKGVYRDENSCKQDAGNKEFPEDKISTGGCKYTGCFPKCTTRMPGKVKKKKKKKAVLRAEETPPAF